MAKLNRIIEAINRLAPMELAESWDRVGLQVGRSESEVKKVLIALDLNSSVLAEGRQHQVDGYIVHHPLIFKPLTSIIPGTYQGSLLTDLIKNDRFLLAAHTNLDNAERGINRYLADLLGLTGTGPIIPIQDSSRHGTGRIGTLPRAVRLDDFCKLVKQKLDAAQLKVTGSPETEIRQIAICSGSGGGFVADVIRQGADLYLTGEMNYHDCWEARERGLAVIEAGHWTTEHCFIPLMADYLERELAGDTGFEPVRSRAGAGEPYRMI